MEFFSRQEHWSGLPCSSPRDLPNSGIKPRSPVMQEDSSPSQPPGKPTIRYRICKIFLHFVAFLFADGAVKGRGAGEAKHETCELSFIWGLTEDCSLGDSLTDSSEDLLGRGGDRGQCVYDSGEGGTSNQAHISGETCC